MKEDNSFLAHDLESLKVAAREGRRRHGNSRLMNQKANRTDIVHAGYRLLQCLAAGIIIVYHISVPVSHEILDVWDMTFVTLYPSCFFASLILAVMRIMNFIPNPKPVIPVMISATGWLAMLTGGIMAMRHAEGELDIKALTDDELADHPTFRHDVIFCSLSLVASSVYLVHAWLCYDCWQWEKKEKKLREASNAVKMSSFTSGLDSDSGMSSNSETEPNYQLDVPAMALPGTSRDQVKTPKSGKRRLSGRASKLLKTFRRSSKTRVEEPADPFTALDEVLHRSVAVERPKVEDEPVRLYCCCMDLGNLIKHKYMTNAPVHEFQVIHVM